MVGLGPKKPPSRKGTGAYNCHTSERLLPRCPFPPLPSPPSPSSLLPISCLTHICLPPFHRAKYVSGHLLPSSLPWNGSRGPVNSPTWHVSCISQHHMWAGVGKGRSVATVEIPCGRTSEDRRISFPLSPRAHPCQPSEV